MTTLLEELQKPAYAAQIAAQSYEAIAATLNAKNTNQAKRGTFLTELGILDLLGSVAGEAFLSGIETAAQQQPVLNRVIRWLRSERGVDVGNEQVQAVLTSLVASNAVTQASANAVIAYGTHQVSLADQNGWGEVGVGLIKNTLLGAG